MIYNNKNPNNNNKNNDNVCSRWDPFPGRKSRRFSTQCRRDKALKSRYEDYTNNNLHVSVVCPRQYNGGTTDDSPADEIQGVSIDSVTIAPQRTDLIMARPQRLS